MFDNWNASAKKLLDQLMNDQRSELCRHGAEIYATEKMIEAAEVRVGWARQGSDDHDCMARIFAKSNGSVELRLHVGIESGLISDSGPLRPVTKTKKPDLGMGKVVLSEHDFPDEVFKWIACANQYSRRRHNIDVHAEDKSTSTRASADIPRQPEAKHSTLRDDHPALDQPGECWLFNTDETESAGKGKHEVMLRKQIVAAWGSCRRLGAEATLNRPKPGDVIFYFRAGYGVIARAVATECFSAPEKSVFREAGEFSRPITQLQMLPDTAALTVAEIKSHSGYQIPYRQIMARILDSRAFAYMDSRFRGVPVDPPKSPSARTSRPGAFFQNDPEIRAAVERAAVRFVTELYEADNWHVKSVERENVGYDLHCTKGDDVECVEVKGSSGSDQRFIMTANELNKAKSDPHFILYVVTDVLKKPVARRYAGSELLSLFTFLPLQFQVKLREHDQS